MTPGSGMDQRRDRLYHFAFFESQEVVIVLDSGRRITSWSQGATQMLGHRFEEVAGKSLDVLVPPSRPAQPDLASFDGAGFKSLEYTLMHSNGLQVKTFVRAYRVPGSGPDDGSVVLYVRPFAVRNYQDLKDPTLRDTMLRMQQLGAVGQLSAGLAHQIRTPLHVVQSTLEFIQSQPGKTLSSFQDELVVMERNLGRIKAISDALAGFARSSEHAFGPGPLNAVVDHLCLFMEIICRKQGVRLKKDTEEVPGVMLDATLLLGALYNLAMNAVEAMPEGGDLTVTTRRHGRGAALTIADTGAGMDPSLVSSISKPFFSTKPAGMGLGLFVARQIIEQHKADLRIESQKGAGTRVTMIFPPAEDA
jgi:signal transduction histidine kinase